MSQWNTSESGILRKNTAKDNFDDLLVFGYACKLFRDDEKALYIDQGKHLIPWMGNESLKIDRYDCRGALSDVSKYEASKEGYDTMRWLGLNEKERNLEELCDKERYYALEINEEEEEMYKEEEEKRQKTNEIQYSYDVPQNPEKEKETPVVFGAEEPEEEYIPSPLLDVPVDIDVPKTVKENARIEKTAMFVCKQGPQMEILIKAKQGSNPQFSFLTQSDKLYKYYRHVLAAFKSGRYHGYKPNIENKTDKMVEPHREGETESSHYLHPSLTSIKPDGVVQIPQVPYKPSSNCTYSQLVNRIQGNQEQQQQQQQNVIKPPEGMTQEQQQQYYQFYMAQQYYDYYKQMAGYQQNDQFVPPADFHNLDPGIQAYIQQIAYNHYLQQQQQHQNNTDNSYAQIVSNVNRDGNLYAANLPQIPTSDTSETKVIVNKPLQSLAAYDSESESEENDEKKEETLDEKDEEREVYKVPSGDTQVVIDKLALYVSKNGEQFEEIVKAKGDPRFEFLNDNHEFNKYYREQIRIYKRENSEIKATEKEETRTVVKKEKKIIAPVSFSLKKPKEDHPKEIKSALPVEESDEEENVTVNTQGVVSPLKNQENSKKEEDKNGLDIDDPLLEMIEETNIEKKESKRAEDRIKDKLAAAAREKLATLSRDKALQLERKRKAAEFLKLKSGENGECSSKSGKHSVEIIDITDGKDNDRERSCSVEIEYKRSRSKSAGRRHKSRSGSKERRRRRDSTDEEKGDRKRKSRKKSHKRKHSKHRSKTKKRSKKHRKRLYSRSSNSSTDSS